MAQVAPFPDFDQFDLIIHTSDDVDIRVHKLILSMASPAFSSMIVMPHPSASATDNQDGLPIVQLEEDARIIEHLLRICYPVKDPVLPKDLKDVKAVLAAALKYEIEPAIVLAKNALVDPDLVKLKPFGTFLVAYHFGLKEAVLLAAQHALMVPDLTDYFAAVSPSPELDGIHGTAMVRLMQWAKVCKAAAMTLVFDKYWWQNQVRQSVYCLCAACLPFNARGGNPYEVLQIDEELRLHIQAAVGKVQKM
ncbi:hypothetical protein IEO21_08163 [Rhodonia placenta]|uniref:BTB domain-containing protein n=1 Tax=Rhodonia placenta TaxID=104341 RepID=A0A8H7TYZ7_9APHY|nr:hypothetical protein IEO21_08163 [Postia placenta]